MNGSKKRVGYAVLWVAGAVLAVALLFVVGSALTSGSRTATTGSSTAYAPDLATPQSFSAARSSAVDAEKSGEAATGGAQQPVQAPSKGGAVEPLVVRTGTMDVRVDDLEVAVSSTRRLARRYDAQISDLAITSGTSEPRPLDADAAQESNAPGYAVITLRVPASRLEGLQTELAALGTLVTQSVSADDVTEQYVDLRARLKNLEAEEARLRGFLAKAGKVSDLLAVERELARVRGEIESMQAQVDYLERQAARATLTVTFTEPGPVVRPDSGSGWGFSEAVTLGIQGAAAVARTLITGLIALLPLALLGLLLWLTVRGVFRRRSRGADRGHDEYTPAEAATGEDADDSGTR